MQQADIRNASDFALQYGCKALVYGPPGSGKTPLSQTAPRPFYIAVEPGMLSLRGSTMPAYVADTVEKIEGVFAWLYSSKDAKTYDTIVIDSISQMCELYLAQESSKKSASGNKVDGKAAYGEMARKCLFHLTNLYFMREKHTYLICKQGYQEIDGVNCLTPYFPGKDLNIKVPHLYDFVLRLDKFFIQGVGQRQALRCIGSMAELARDRSGRLSEFEPCDLAALFKKATS